MNPARPPFISPALPAATTDVRYFDQSNGVSQFRVYLDKQLIAEWSANDHLPATIPNGDSSTRHRIRAVQLYPGNELRIEGRPDGPEHAALDYVEFIPSNPAWEP